VILFPSCARDGKCNEKTYNPENTVIRNAHKNYADTVYDTLLLGQLCKDVERVILV
jgi:hypothetical protein